MLHYKVDEANLGDLALGIVVVIPDVYRLYQRLVGHAIDSANSAENGWLVRDKKSCQ
ncbi:MAG: hypothetical protein ACM338_07900 [Betaproteobacteria bacterium]